MIAGRTSHRWLGIGILIAVGALGFAAQKAAAKDAVQDLSAVVAEMVDNAILPAYQRFTIVSQKEVSAMVDLCADPDADTLSAARVAFADLVAGFATVEAMRFGPARDGNRFERLFFWPDRRSRGIRQVETILRERDVTASDASQLEQKSVAVQGILALEFALFNGTPDSELLERDSFRCRYALAVSQRVAATADELFDAWQRPGGFADQMKNPAKDQPIYRTHGEALQEILRSVAEVLTIGSEFKIGRVIGEDVKASRVKRAPLWRSGLWLSAISGNIAFVEALFFGPALADVLGEDNASLPSELLFELEQARRAVRDANQTWAERDADIALRQDEYDLLHYATLPLAGAATIVSERLPEALGLVIGFNSLDGD